MKVVAINSYGDRARVREAPIPRSLAANELLVRVRAAGMNPVDSAIARGLMQRTWPAAFPLTLGSDFAGSVEKVGVAVERYTIGDAVYGKIQEEILHQGAYADYLVIPETGCVSTMPQGLRFTEAAALPTAAMTAVVCVDAAHIEPGKRVLVVGATGGVGSFAVQLATGMGAHVIATAHDLLADYVRARGAAAVIDYRRVNLTEAIARNFPEGLDAVIDVVSDGAHLDDISHVVHPGGIVVSTIGAANVRSLALRSVRGVNVGFRPTVELLRRVTKAVDAGRLLPSGVQTVSFDHAQQALDDLAGGHVHGKLVLTTS